MKIINTIYNSLYSKHIILKMSIYPIISKYDDINFDKIKLSKPKTYTITPTISPIIEPTHYLKIYSTYDLLFEYDRIGIDKFCIITQFLKISGPPKINKNGIYFCIDMENNTQLHTLLTELLNITTNLLLNENPNLSISDINLPIKNFNHFGTIKNYVVINLLEYNKKITTPIHYHRTKKQGGGVMAMTNIKKDNFINNILEEMTLFKNDTYGIKNTKNDKIPLMYYNGKFTLCVSAKICENINPKTNKTENQYCNIIIYSKEIETKYNVSHVISVLDNDITHLNKQVTDQSYILSI